VTSSLITGLLWFAAIGSGLIAGVFFAFSTSIMGSLGRLDHSSGIAAMRAINMDILGSIFMPMFVGTTAASAALAVLAVLLAGGAPYVVGVFVLTVAFNVPLNDALATVNLTGPDSVSLWATYLKSWTFWNHVRLLASVLSNLLFIRTLSTAW
jgi:uncharacterized membrane protein